MFGAALAIAVLASVLIHAFGAPAGVPAALAVAALALVRGGPVHRLCVLLGLDAGAAARGRRLVAATSPSPRPRGA